MGDCITQKNMVSFVFGLAPLADLELCSCMLFCLWFLGSRQQAGWYCTVSVPTSILTKQRPCAYPTMCELQVKQICKPEAKVTVGDLNSTTDQSVLINLSGEYPISVRATLLGILSEGLPKTFQLHRAKLADLQIRKCWIHRSQSRKTCSGFDMF